ncbi:MAG: hypothetical protein GAK29_00137 [Acinetobacter bereziniae]|uniref:Uncharacterized protein n=1 Tax=Acinetobacter bereziniae TaxID=106648 RepID=A0A833UXL7_ACIBZ|nr:MAG: hypothetical protein GAK29_00137 [Acinetobacter bereziniae]
MWGLLNQKIKYLLSVFSLLMFSSLSHLAWAEGNCPQGMYPVGGQGVMGCAPIPNYGGGGGVAIKRQLIILMLLSEQLLQAVMG